MSTEARGAALAALCGALLAVPLALPLAAHPRATLWGLPGDGYGTLAGIEAVRRWLGGEAASLPLAGLQPLVDLPAGLLASLVGAVAAYNLLMLASFPLAAAFGWLAARALGLGPRTALFAGLALAFAPVHLGHAEEHLDQAQTWPVAVVAWAALRLARAPSAARMTGLLAACAVAVLVNGYLAVVAAPLLVCGVLATLAAPDAGRRPALVTLLSGGLLAASLSWWLVGDRIELAFQRRPALLRERGGDLIAYSARPAEYLRPSLLHPVLGAWAEARFAADRHGSSRVEQNLALGLVPLALAAAGLATALRVAGVERRLALLLLGAALGALWLSLPPPWGGGEALFRSLPWFRAVARFAIVVQAAVVLLAGLGLARCGPRLAGLAVLAVAFEYLPAPRAHPVEPIEAGAWLEQNASRVADLPARPYRYLRLFRPLAVPHLGVELLEDAGAAEAAGAATPERLAALGVSHVAVHGRGDEPVAEGLTLAAGFRGLRIFRVNAAPPPVVVLAREGFASPGPEGQRWMTAGSARLELRATGTVASVEGALHARLVGGEAWALEVTAERGGRSVVQRVDLRSGRAELVLDGMSPAVQGTSVLLRGASPWTGARLHASGAHVVLVESPGFSPHSWVDGGGRLTLDSGFHHLEAGDARWVDSPALLSVWPSSGAARLSFEVRAIDPPRTLVLRARGRELGRVEVGRDWSPVSVPVESGEVELNGGRHVRLAALLFDGDPREVAVAVRRLRLER